MHRAADAAAAAALPPRAPLPARHRGRDRHADRNDVSVTRRPAYWECVHTSLPLAYYSSDEQEEHEEEWNEHENASASQAAERDERDEHGKGVALVADASLERLRLELLVDQ
eukprot:scaffold27853_cov47-Phaeocystis_antarctica.AAC.1